MPENDLELLIRAARAAGEIAAGHWRNSPKVWDKPGHQGPVTEADLAIDAALREMLGAARPDYGWLSEESEDSEDRLGAERVFIVDPLDGTRAFVKGERAFANVLAVAEAGEVIAAAVFLPMLDRMFSASRGQGAALNGAPIRHSGRHGLEGAALLAARPALAPEFWAERPPAVDLHSRPSLAYRQCLVAQGRFDAMLTLRDSWHWDLAAGALILEEAGATVTDRAGKPLRFNTPRPQSPGILAAPPALHAEILRRLA
ncbi:3'(2'),5'-bisphosphate nucleotidase CysQ [Actibacterium sp. MT2.3-13A]|uniref:inositol monophosphatase family protein n=1 Tax=Actibacterium sp. MT2.3-13A TaxID=2828332 RepID=UPI001BA8A5A9|nr:3'(2'),5'-bisphosphate nucleotidase CysQ [Actibacterium sp. MT2.3-13A]